MSDTAIVQAWIKVAKTTDLRKLTCGNVGGRNQFTLFQSANGIDDIFWEYGSFLT